jgi:ribosomal protein S18 acetylase RimI-like enzyme
VAGVKALFLALHAFNAALDPRFALSEDWEAHFDAEMGEALRGHEALCILVCEQGSGRICGFVLAAIHRDSRMWQYREWVEVEALYVEGERRGQGFASALLAHTYAWANSVGRDVVQLYVTASNKHALGFYRRQGFRETQAVLRKVLA